MLVALERVRVPEPSLVSEPPELLRGEEKETFWPLVLILKI